MVYNYFYKKHSPYQETLRSYMFANAVKSALNDSHIRS